MFTLPFLKMSAFNYPVTRRHIPQERNTFLNRLHI